MLEKVVPFLVQAGYNAILVVFKVFKHSLNNVSWGALHPYLQCNKEARTNISFLPIPYPSSQRKQGGGQCVGSVKVVPSSRSPLSRAENSNNDTNG